MTQSVAQTEAFEQIFAKPTIQAMLGLTPTGFEHFVEYVFERAGFRVNFVAGVYNGSGIDLELHTTFNGHDALFAVVQVKRFTDDVAPHFVNALVGTTLSHLGARGYLVTTSDYKTDARNQAGRHNNIALINGQQFIRYINYIRGSRVEGDANVTIPPECIISADGIQRRSAKQTRVIAIANNKGGIGKTTTAINMAQVLDSQNERVLLVDLDSQGNLTSLLPEPTDVVSNPNHLGTYLSHRARLSDIIRQTAYKNVWLIPSAPNVRLIDPGANGFTNSILEFARDLHAPEIMPLPHQTREGFDWIILDTPTAVEYRIRLALGAAHYVIIPTQVESFAISGINLLRDSANSVKALVGGSPHIAGGLVTDYRGRGELSGNIATGLRAALFNEGVNLFHSIIHHHEGIETTHRLRRNPFAGNSRRELNPAAREYQAFVKELSEYVNSNN